MKIAIASDDGKNISSHFGRTKGFVVFKVDGKEIKGHEYRPNSFTGHTRGLKGKHDADHNGPILNALSDCKVVISRGMGRRIYDDLKSVGLEVFVIDETDVEKAVKLYLNGELIDRPESGCHHKHE